MAEANLDANQINLTEEKSRAYICDIDSCKWYADVIYYLQHMVSPHHLSNNEKRTMKLHALRFVIISGKLWWRSQDKVLFKCISKEKLVKILIEMHGGICRGHYMSKKIARKVLRAGFQWPTFFNDAYDLVRKCYACQRFFGKL